MYKAWEFCLLSSGEWEVWQVNNNFAAFLKLTLRMQNIKQQSRITVVETNYIRGGHVSRLGEKGNKDVQEFSLGYD